MVILTGDSSCNSQGTQIYFYALVSMQHGEVSCLLILNGDRHLLRDLEDIIVPGHGEGCFWIIKSLELHEMILRIQDSTLEVRHEETSDFQELYLPFFVNHLVVKGYLMSFSQGGTNSVY